MNPVHDPFTPGPGMVPAELVGRDELRETLRIALERVRIGRPAKSAVLVGLRGVGKTALLDCVRHDAESAGILTLAAEAQEGRPLPALLVPGLRQVFQHLAQAPLARDMALVNPRALEHDPVSLLERAGQAARAAGTALALFIDELHHAKEVHLAMLLNTMQQLAQLQLPVVLVGAGLPQTQSRVMFAKSNADRLYDFPLLGPLPPNAARSAICKPLEEEQVQITEEALARVLEASQGYPFLLQQWGSHAWRAAESSPIDLPAIIAAAPAVMTTLDESFNCPRFERLAPKEKRYLRAMAELGPGPHRSGDIAECLGAGVSTLAVTRSGLILKGLVWSPHHGETAFTTPIFDTFLKRSMPGNGWRQAGQPSKQRLRRPGAKPLLNSTTG